MNIAQSAEIVFWDYVCEAFKAQRVAPVFEQEAYLTLLLHRFVRQDEDSIIDKPLFVELYKNSRRVGTDSLANVRFIADASLFTAGVVAPYVRKSMGINHYIRVGECAYEILFLSSKKGDEFFPIYQSFYKNLRPYVRVLSYVARRHIYDVVESVVCVYERYLATGGDEEDRKFLKDHGVIV